MGEQNPVISCARQGAKKYKEEELAYIRRFASIDSPSLDEEASRTTVEVVEEMLGKLSGIQIQREYAPGCGYNVIARLKPEHPDGKIVLSAHTDTVFRRGEAAAHPYHEEGDRAYGLGVADCKGGLVVSIYAVRIMQEAGLLPNKEIVFLFTCDEEVGAPSGNKVFQRELEGTDMAFFFEPSREENGVLTQRKGWCRVMADVTGRQAHTGINYLDGRSAITEIAHLIQRFYESAVPEQGIYFNAGKVENDDPLNIVSGHACVEFCVRVANKADMDTVYRIVDKLEKEPPYIDGVSRTFRIEPHLPMERTKANVALYEKVRSIGQLLGHQLPEQKSGGSGDASFFAYHGIPTVDGLGVYMYKIHSVEESMRISSVEEKTCLFGTILGCLDSL